MQRQGLLALLDITARDRHDVVLARQLDLEDDQILPAEGGFRAGEIEIPHAAEALVVDRLGLVTVDEEACPPVLERLGIVEAKDLDVVDHQPRLLDRRHYLRKGRDVAAREDVFTNEGAGGEWRSA